MRLVAPEGGFVGETVRGTTDPAGAFDPLYGQSSVVGTGTLPGAGADLQRGRRRLPQPHRVQLLRRPAAVAALDREAGTYYVAVWAQNLTGEEDATLP